MHIKRIIIQGFKTYKNTTVIDLVSPRHNVVVGRNGSGKSNFFAAIRFVLSDAYTHMTREERKGLIHEGSGNVMSAYVEIVFDNEDRRFPIAKDELAVRRTIGLKKDDYSLDGKSATRSDIMNLLESAGFSRSNPYYIVPQGRITSLTNSKDSERLALLKEVSGAKVFETKFKESMKEMSNSNFKKERTEEALQSLDARLSDLQIESNDLKEYQVLEKSKKILEYKIFDSELNKLTASIDENEEKYSDLLESSQQDLEELKTREIACQDLIDTISKLKTDLKVVSVEKSQTETDYHLLLKAVSEKEIHVNELKASINENQRNAANSLTQIEKYRTLISTNESKYESLKPELQRLQQEESRVKAELSDLNFKQRALYAKQHRFTKFANQKQRDQWLKKEIQSIQKEVDGKSTKLEDLNQQIVSQNEILLEFEHHYDELNDSLNSPQQLDQISVLKKDINELRAKVVELTDEKKALWRSELKFRSIQDSLESDLSTANYQVNQTMDRAQAKGLNAVRAIAERLNLTSSVYGPLAEMFHVSDKYKTAVEVVAGNALFHVVVDTDETASILMNELVRLNAGRVTFMPLNRIRPREVQFPDSDLEYIPLIKKIKHDVPEIKPALAQVFGSTIVCSSLSKCSEFARSYRVNAITLDGDRADTKGTLSGGYRDYKNSRLDALKVQAKRKKELVNVQGELAKCNEDIEVINAELTALNNELQTKTRQLDQVVSSREPVSAEMAQISNKKYNTEQVLATLKTNVQSLEITRQNFVHNIENHQAELKSAFTQSLNDEELATLSSFTAQINQLEKQFDDIVTELATAEASMSGVESELSNYRLHLRKLVSGSDDTDKQLVELELSNLETELETLKGQLNRLEARNKSVGEQYHHLSKEITKNETALKKANDQQVNIMKKLEKFSKATEKCLSKKSILSQRREEVTQKIADLGALPEEAFSSNEYDEMSSDELLSKLRNVNQELTKYAHINKKAMEQYSTFTREREELMERRDELERSKESIEQLIVQLERQKDQAITKSFKQISKSFHDIFEKLVPAGTGNLIMQKKSDLTADESDDEEILAANVDDYVGVSISVSFNSKHDEQQRIEQLSGGQKSLCAITLILAIQECDPAPFYLFDEIDANLDTHYRTAVANMIKSLSHSAQFICTTFRPEMLQVADKFYGVMFSDKVSTVSEIDQSHAMNFVETQR